MCHQMLPASCDLFIPSCDCCSFIRDWVMCENMSPGFKKGLPRGLANMWCNPACRAAVRCKGGSPNDVGI